MLALDGNCKIMLFTLIQYSDYAAGDDCWFFAPNTMLQTQAGMSKNLVTATLDTLYQAGIIDIECIGVGVGHKSNKIRLKTSSFDKYDNYKVDEILSNPELQIHTVNYKNNYSPSYIQVGKKVCKKVNTIIDNISNIDNINNIDNKNISNNILSIDIPIKERENPREKEIQTPGTGMCNAPDYLKKFYVHPDVLYNELDLPKEEFSLQTQYNDVILKYSDFKKMGVDEDKYQPETITWEENHDYSDMIKYISNWDTNGRAELAEEVQGLKPNIKKEIVIYLMNFKALNAERLSVSA